MTDSTHRHTPGSPAVPAGTRRRWWLIGGAAALIVVVVLAALAWGGDRDPAVRGGVAPSASPPGLEELREVLTLQGQALVAGDESGWLAPVDPFDGRLVAAYRDLYANLRGLDVTAWQVMFPVPPPLLVHGRDSTAPVTVAYCFSRPACPPPQMGAGIAPQVRLELTVRTVERVTITGLDPPWADYGTGRPLPWETGRLAFAHGSRVTLAAPPALAGRFPAVLAAAEDAAAVVDRVTTGFPRPDRYRVYLAGRQQWNTWYGGDIRPSALGYAYQGGQVSVDVVIDDTKLQDPARLATVLRHELGHAVTVTGSNRYAAFGYNLNQWLVEGVAEYLAYQGGHPRASPRTAAVARVVRTGKLRPTITLIPLADDATMEDSNLFYGLAHYAVACLAAVYGLQRMFAFYRAVVVDQDRYDASARAHLGVAWAAADRRCQRWIATAVG